MESTTQIFLRVQVTDDEHDVVSGEALVEGYADRMQIESFSFDMKAKLQSPGPADEKPKHNCQFGHVVVKSRNIYKLTRMESTTLHGRGS